MARKFQELENKMAPESRARAKARAREMMTEMLLSELRKSACHAGRTSLVVGHQTTHAVKNGIPKRHANQHTSANDRIAGRRIRDYRSLARR